MEQPNQEIKTVPDKKMAISIVILLIIALVLILALRFRGGQSASNVSKLVPVSGKEQKAAENASSEAPTEKNQSTEAPREKAQSGTVKNYKNEKLGISFDYPANFKVTYAGCANPKETECNWHKLVFADQSASGEPEIRVDINPDNFDDPKNVSRVYELEETPDGKIKINSEDNLTSEDENFQSDRDLIMGEVASAKNDSDYIFQFPFAKTGLDWELVFKEILASVQFSELPDNEKNLNKL